MSELIKRVPNPGVFLLETGLLYEINRTILHPLGLALEVEIDKDGSRVGGLWDFRDDPEGIIYGKKMLEAGEAKYMKYMKSVGVAKMKSREAALGFVVQKAKKR